MTTQEQKTVNAIGLKQATMEANQNYMSNDIQEMKADIKEIKNILLRSNDLYVSKKAVKYLVGLAISIGILLVQYWDHVINKH